MDYKWRGLVGGEAANQPPSKDKTLIVISNEVRNLNYKLFTGQ
jgi:hypothetical protein